VIPDDFRQAHDAATEDAAAAPLDDWATVNVEGADGAQFLHNMCTNDIRSLQPGEGCEAFFTDVKGKIVAHAFVLAGTEALQLIVAPGQSEPLIAHLDRYIIRERVTLSDASAALRWKLLVGRQAAATLRRLGVAGVRQPSTPWSHSRVAIASVDVQCVRCPLPWCGGYLLGIQANHVADVASAIRDAGAEDCAEDVWHAIRIESSWPLWEVDFDSTNLPQEIGRDALAIHFRKGCYLGQETIARIDALGHVNKQLVQLGIHSASPPSAGAELYKDEQPVGRITSAAWSPRAGGPLALAMIRRGANEPGAVVRCGASEAVVVQLDDRLR
jgi:folate-binding protein YgfZ